MFLNYWEDIFPIAHSINRSLVEGNKKFTGIAVEDVEIFAPVPNPTSCRDAYAFASMLRGKKKPANGYDTRSLISSLYFILQIITAYKGREKLYACLII